MNELTTAVSQRGIDSAQWATLTNSLYPGAQYESVLMAVDYCRARNLDPMKKPCHIVPMSVKTGRGYEWRDVILPGIYEYRTTAHRTGQYLGHSTPEYGPEAEHLGTSAPAWCAITAYRWNKEAGQKCEYPVKVFFREIAATTLDKETKEYRLNGRWSKAPIQMLTKCTEAAALREAFPDEFGGEMTAEEMEGRVIEGEVEAVEPKQPTRKHSPRPEEKLTPAQDGYAREFAFSMRNLMNNTDIEEDAMISQAMDLHAELNEDQLVYIAAADMLEAKERAAWKRLVQLGNKAAKQVAA